MINLLPQKEKEFLSLSAKRNLVVVLGVISIIFIACMLLTLFAVKFFILNEGASQKFLLQDAEKKYQSKEIVDLKIIIQKYNKKIPVILSFYKKDLHMGDVLAFISTIKKDGLNFNNISLDGSSYEDIIRVNISGTSDSRENLLAFQKEIEQHKEMKNIYFSPESWINPAKSNFSLTFDFYKNGN